MSIVTTPIYILVNNAQEATSSLTCVNSHLLDDSHSNWPEVIVVSISIPLIISDIEQFFCVYLLVIFIPWKNVFSVSLHNFNLN